MRVGLLGGLEVLDDDERDLPIPGAKLRALLAVLALHAGRVVPTEQLVDALWGENPPAAVRNGLQGLASKLRRALGSSDLVTMRGEGYALELPAEAIDVHRYEHLVASGRTAAAAGDLEGAAERLAEADALWRGDALSDFTYEDFAAGTITRLSELRLTAIEERLHIELQLGHHLGAIALLEELVATHPYRERLRELLMLALYRSGRQTDALRTFQDGRLVLGEELGLEPGPELRQVEAAILAQDPALDVPVAPSFPGLRAEGRWIIPEPLTTLVGRDVELRELTKLASEHRLVTLVGPGGVGKTRLGLEVARSMSGSLTFGGCLVELAPVGDPIGVATAIASALDLADPNRLAEVIGDHDMLLVLDNCEHVITTAAEIAEDLLRRCPNLRLIATSREGLRVGGEHIWPVPPLAAEDAASLFVARAHAGGAPVADAGDDDLALIADICARLDGLPLAIELAAARTRAFPMSQIASRLHDRFCLLTGGSRTALPRQQTLRAVVDWSYELLFDHEQQVFERLSVFPGGCDLATAEAVLADEELPEPDIADHLQALVDKSLVIARPSGDGLRYTQLQTLAHYGKEKLTERGDAVRIRDAMAAHYAALCSQSAAAFTGPIQRAWLTAIDQEHDNLKAALDWAVANDDANAALTIAGGSSWPHWLAGTVLEGKRWLDDAFACGGEAHERARALAWTGRGLIDFLLGEADHSDEDLRAALEVFHRIDDRASMALAQSFYAETPVALGDIAEARRRRLAILDFYEDQPDDAFAVAGRSYSHAKLALLKGDLAAAERHYRAATEGFAELDRPVMVSICLGMVADFDERAGDFRAAIATLDAAIETNETLIGGFTGSLLARLGWVLLLEGQLARAEDVYHRALDSGRRVRHALVVFLALTGIAALHRLHERDQEAVAAATEAMGIYRAGGPRRFRNRVDHEVAMRTAAAVCCTLLAAVAADGANPEEAAVLLGETARHRSHAGAEVPGFQREDAERAHRAAVSALDPAAFAAAFARGQRAAEGAAGP